MIKITKNEAFELRKLGYDKFVKHTWTRYRHYYLVESFPALKALEKIKREHKEN